MGVSLGLTQREEHGQRVFENRVPRKILGRDRHEVAGDWGGLCIVRIRIRTPQQITSGDHI